MKRDDGTYWPTICQTYQGNELLSTPIRFCIILFTLAAATSAIAYCHRNHKLFVGLSTGLILVKCFVCVRVCVCVCVCVCVHIVCIYVRVFFL